MGARAHTARNHIDNNFTQEGLTRRDCTDKRNSETLGVYSDRSFGLGAAARRDGCKLIRGDLRAKLLVVDQTGGT